MLIFIAYILDKNKVSAVILLYTVQGYRRCIIGKSRVVDARV